jgi:uncharacterized protein YndB with AHSA1/START domain
MEEAQRMTRDILLAVEMEAEATTITDALTTKEGLSSFWTHDVVADPEAGTEARFGFAAAPLPLVLRVDRIEPGREVTWTEPRNFPYWDQTTITWTLSDGAEPGGTKVLLRQVGFPDAQAEWEFASVAYTWAIVLERLKLLAETGHADPALG